MFSAGLAMLVLALAALVMISLRDHHDGDDQARVEEPGSERDGLPHSLTTV
jgi:hypothetical protein